jgi:hypothetical protein
METRLLSREWFDAELEELNTEPEVQTLKGGAGLVDAAKIGVDLAKLGLDVGKFAWDVIQGNKAVVDSEATTTSVLYKNTNGLDYEGARPAATHSYSLSVRDSLIKSWECIHADIVCEGTYHATPRNADIPAGYYLPAINVWLLGRALKLSDATLGSDVPVVDPGQQYESRGANVSRQRVRNNLPGTPEFCPLVFRTGALDSFIAMDLAKRAQAVMAEVPKGVLARTAPFLLLKDSRSSFAIEGEKPPQDRLQRWRRTIGEAGRNPTDLEELLRLQEMVIGDGRLTSVRGLRTH